MDPLRANPNGPPTSRSLVSSAYVHPPQSTTVSTPIPVETLICVLQRLEAKLDASDQRQAPPCEMPWDGRSPPWPSGSIPTPSTAVTLPVMQPVSTVPWSPMEECHRVVSGLQGGPVWRTAWDPPLEQRSSNTPIQPPTAWDRPVGNRGENYGPRLAWEPNQGRGGPPHNSFEPSRYMRLDPPMFDGTDAQSWVTRVQYYFDYIMLPLDQRLHCVIMLFSPPASDWVFSYRANNPHVSWPQFLDDVRRRFDPNYFVNYIELLSKLSQTGSLSDYNNEFECLMNRSHGLTEPMLLPIYIDLAALEEVEEKVEDAVTEPEFVTMDLPHLYSLDGQPRASYIELIGSLGKVEVCILVDTGSIHNFVHPRIAERCRLPLVQIEPFRVYMGNGQSLMCSHKSLRAELCIQGNVFRVDLFVLTLHGPSMVLGMDWLHELRRVTTDYEKGTFEFQSEGRPICL